MKNKYTYVILSCMLLGQSSVCLCNKDVANKPNAEIERHGPFNPAMINFIDGASFGVDGIVVGIILRVRTEVLKILEGELQPNKTRQGLYTYRGKKYCVKQLKELEKQLASRRSPVPEEFQECLETTKADFTSKMHKFLEPARAIKQHILPLIEDFCNYYNVENSPLLHWGEAYDEQSEKEMFDSEIVNFDTLEVFCKDLNTFLKELISNCPKGKAQFKKMIADMRNKKQ